jgi:hypothetical protein
MELPKSLPVGKTKYLPRGKLGSARPTRAIADAGKGLPKRRKTLHLPMGRLTPARPIWARSLKSPSKLAPSAS